MNYAKSYRCRQTGNVLYKADIPDRWRITRYLPPKVKQAGKMVQPTIQFIFPPALEENYDQLLFDLADIDPIQPVVVPKHQKFSHRAELGEPVESDGMWIENWIVTKRFSTTARLRAALIEMIGVMADKKRDRGIIHKNIKVGTDLAGLVLLDSALIAAQSLTDFVDGENTHQLTTTQIAAMYMAASKHVQSVFTEESQLIAAVKKSTNPMSVDLSILKK